MGYTITAYSRARAKKLGVIIKQSTRKGKKLDVFKKVKNSKGEVVLKRVATIGALGMGDYPTFIKTKGKEFADKRRKAYKSRMAKNRKVVGSNGYYADKILW
jgi:hypothetical protein